jgi:phosphopantothenate---cysteine ligase (CTP)
MKKILITGGPVHAYLDDVKIITNRFKGGLMADLAEKFIKMSHYTSISKDRIHVTYLCSKDSKQPRNIVNSDPNKPCEEITPYLTVVYHNGIDDYIGKVLCLAPQMDAIILGAAVANLVPKDRITGKFPSHDYKIGDTIPIDFTIAPRVIDAVKEVNPNVHLFGFKLLSGVDYYELVRAAYGVLLESKAVTVFANDAKDLMQKYAVTKERGVHPLHNDELPQWILDRMNEKYYSTKTAELPMTDKMKEGKLELMKILAEHRHSFVKTDEGYVFGSGALLLEKDPLRFVTTARGKEEWEDFVFVDAVNHDNRKVFCTPHKKASLNAPLFHYMFSHLADIKYILHFHHQRAGLITLDYATPGTDQDSTMRTLLPYRSFNIKGHGCILSYGENGELLK